MRARRTMDDRRGAVAAGATPRNGLSGKGVRAALGALILVGLLVPMVAGCRGRKPRRPPDQSQSAERVEAIRAMELARDGTLRLGIHRLDRPLEGESGDEVIVGYVLQSPRSPVQDTEIRGFLDGKTKYPFNQGTAYHMRVGRRIDGPFDGELELKRSLLRWELPELPAGARLVEARVRLWVEGLSLDSPIREDDGWLPLHAFAYPLLGDWGPGEGGVGRDSFSEAAPGEASWNEARAGSLSWTVPGGLAADAAPVAAGVIDGDERWLTLRGDALLDLLEDRLSAGGNLDLLLKLDDDEEDRWGTEVALLSSNFGDEHDAVSKRPQLLLDVALPGPDLHHEEEFILESGSERVLPPLRHGGRPVLIRAELITADSESAHPPELWIRGGKDGEQRSDEDWTLIRAPILRDWDWSQVKISTAPRRMVLGEDLSIRLEEPWVSPGPREEQLPNAILVSPSGEIRRIEGRPAEDLHYRIDFRPDEPGLWRYGWSYLPRSKSPPGSHQGEGLFYVALPEGEGAAEAMRQWARTIAESLAGRPSSRGPDQYRLNAVVRWAASHSYRGEAEREEAREILEELRQALPPKFRPRGEKK